MNAEQKFVSCPAAADLVGLSYWAILRAVRSGDLKAVFPNPAGRPLIGQSELRRWCRSIGIEPDSEAQPSRVRPARPDSPSDPAEGKGRG
jgi:hypothetical protein